MKKMKVIYAVVLAVIYITATSLSSISLLTCQHDHHSHPEHHHDSCHHSCHCDHEALGTICCDHDHPILGEHHTDYVVNNQRHDSSSSLALIMLLSPRLITEQTNYEAWLESPIKSQYVGYEAAPLMAAPHQTEALRAPPTLV
jgi:hypothetical protein